MRRKPQISYTETEPIASLQIDQARKTAYAAIVAETGLNLLAIGLAFRKIRG